VIGHSSISSGQTHAFIATEVFGKNCQTITDLIDSGKIPQKASEKIPMDKLCS